MTPGVEVLVVEHHQHVADHPHDGDYDGGVGVGVLVQAVSGHKTQGEECDDQVLQQDQELEQCLR